MNKKISNKDIKLNKENWLEPIYKILGTVFFNC